MERNAGAWLAERRVPDKVISALLVCVLSLSLCWLPAAAEDNGAARGGPVLHSPDAQLIVTPAASSVGLGNSLRINLDYVYDPAYGLYGFDVRLQFDQAAVQANSTQVTRGPLLASWGSLDFINSVNNATGAVTYVRYGINPDAEIFASDVMFYFDVTGIAVGQTCITVVASTLSTRDGVAIPHTTQAGCFYVYNPTAVTVSSFTATSGGNAITLAWTSASEVDNLGFNLYRATALDGPRTRLNRDLITSRLNPGNPAGAAYSYVDARLDKTLPTHYYWLESVAANGRTQLHGPVQASLLFPARYLTPPVAPPTDH